MDRDKDTKYLKLPTLRILAPINELIEAFTIEEFNDKVKLNNISDLKFKCIVCPQYGANECFFERNLLRQHIGQHMLQGHIKSHENLCGFCGTVCGSNNEIVLKTGNIKSSCKYFYNYSSGAAVKSSKRSPCTNRLVPCPSCDVAIWTYNIATHYINRHGTLENLLFEHLTPTREELNNVYNWGTNVIPKSSGVKKTKKSKNSCIKNT